MIKAEVQGTGPRQSLAPRGRSGGCSAGVAHGQGRGGAAARGQSDADAAVAAGAVQRLGQWWPSRSGRSLA